MTVKKKGCSKKSIFPEELLRKSNCRVEVVILKKWLLWRSSYCKKVASPAIKLFWKFRYMSEKGDRHLKGHRNSHRREISRETEKGDSNSHVKLELMCLIKVFFFAREAPSRWPVFIGDFIWILIRVAGTDQGRNNHVMFVLLSL